MRVSSMICNNCKREIDEPLNLFNGDWACPRCCEKIEFATKALEETEENKELFIHGETHLLKALVLKDEATDIQKHFEELIAAAYYFFQQAAKLGNPSAFYRLGYLYDKDLIDKNRTEKNRCQIAMKYYLTVCKKAKQDSDKEKAAIALVKMLSANGSFPNETSLYTKEYASYLKGIDLSKVKASTNYYEFVSSTLRSLSERALAPAFGTLTVSSSDLNRLVEYAQTIPPDVTVQIYMDGQQMVCVNGNRRTSNDFISLAEWLITDKKNLDLSRKVTIVFCKTKFHSKKLDRKAKAIFDKIMGNKHKYILSLLKDLIYSDTVFYEDDLIFYLNRRSVDQGLSALAKAACNKK